MNVEIWSEKEEEYIMGLPDSNDIKSFEIAVQAYDMGYKKGFREGTEFGLNSWRDKLEIINKYIEKIKEEKNGSK